MEQQDQHQHQHHHDHHEHHHHHHKRDAVSIARDRVLRNNVLRHKAAKWLKIILTVVAAVMVGYVVYLYYIA